ncbi:MAG: DUF6575 domain-containing protein [Synechococcales bacterium]|nr:DUF6575 domain-containing protein [Synechococcales bacterium]
MNLLPTLTYLGKLHLVEVYEADDEPCLFACQSASGQIYLVVFVDETEAYKDWLYVALSQKRFVQLRSGTLDLYDGFKRAEDERVHLVKVPLLDDVMTSTVETLPCEQLTDNMLPLPGEFLRLVAQPV